MSKQNETNNNFLKNFSGFGVDEMTNNDFSIPFLRICQQLTKNRDTEKIKLGNFYNTINFFDYGNTLKVVPLYRKKELIEWNKDTSKFVARYDHDDEYINNSLDKNNFAKWTNVGTGNTVIEVHNYFCLLPDYIDHGILIFSLSKTGIPHAKKWNTLIQSIKLEDNSQAPIFACVWELKTTECVNQKGNYFQIGDSKTNIQKVKMIDEDFFTKYIVSNLEVIRKNNLQIDYTHLEQDYLSQDNTVVEKY